MSSYNYKHKSGCQKRKDAKKIEEDKKKSIKITSFFSSETSWTTPAEQEEVDENVEKMISENTSQEADSAYESVKENNLDNEPETDTQKSIYVPRISEWPDTKTDRFIEAVLFKFPKSDSIENSQKMYKDNNQTYYRHLNNTIFYRVKANGDKEEREWLIYDSQSNSIFCFPCKLFSKDVNSLSSKSGYGDWKNVSLVVSTHEKSKGHVESMCTLAHRISNKNTIDTEFKTSILKECEYWRQVLKRIVATIKFLSSQGLAFRGQDENLNSKHRGNYLSCLLYLSEFDPFLADHLRNFGNKGKNTVSYLSHQICDEFIILLEKHLIQLFAEELKTARYFSIIVDSTPDVSHSDQLCFILRYIKDGKSIERFLGFIKIEKHTGEYLESVVLEKIKKLGLDIKNCRGQSYDNAANMSGIYNGLQAKIKESSSSAFYIPCSNHSLNLVINFASESCLQASNFFGFLQAVYVFFSNSTHRWDLMASRCDISVKRVIETRWSARADAVKALHINYKTVMTVLLEISNDKNEKAGTRGDALNLFKKMNKYETALLTIVWSTLLSRCNATSKTLEDPSLNLSDVVNLIKSLVAFVNDIRNNSFSSIENEAANLINSESEAQNEDETGRNRKRKLFFDERKNEHEILSKSEKFRIETFNVICDSTIRDLSRKLQSYESIKNCFNCFFTKDPLEYSNSIMQLKKTYKDDIELYNLEEEVAQFNFLCEEANKKTILEKFDLVQTLKSTFPNVLTLLQIFVCLPISNASGERSFSAMDKIKNSYRASLGQEKFDALSVLYIESEALNDINYDEIIDKFANQKARKKFI